MFGFDEKRFRNLLGNRVEESVEEVYSTFSLKTSSTRDINGAEYTAYSSCPGSSIVDTDPKSAEVSRKTSEGMGLLGYFRGNGNGEGDLCSQLLGLSMSAGLRGVSQMTLYLRQGLW
ncbi:hypothetical protein DPEC_G00122660 [Dallia pectoralis]|uniref:Uncharacterized protein n=1 Tax=Dallia pectoralis TaxID=75939 RepID=A0ACC2GQF4_DALPE|nr:hypothetical protein DPEC_G00122660 [Dallia pectoralis]